MMMVLGWFLERNVPNSTSGIFCWCPALSFGKHGEVRTRLNSTLWKDIPRLRGKFGKSSTSKKTF